MTINKIDLESKPFTAMNKEEVRTYQGNQLHSLVKRVALNSSFYQDKFHSLGLEPDDIQSLDDITKLPFTEKQDLREGYPLKYMAVPESEVVRIHSSSGTTGKPVIIPYTKNDVDTFTEMMRRTMETVGVHSMDRVQITPGYGLWTAGIGFQAGVEKLGALAIPTGPGNTNKQLQMMQDLKSTVLIGTSSYGLLLAEEIKRREIMDQTSLRMGIFGSERWGDKMRFRIEAILGIETFDIYGLTEIYGPGIAIDCPEHQGLHYWNDYLIFEIIDPQTGQPLPVGEKGELVITTLTKEGLPLIRYRTHDLTCLLPDPCPCGSPYPLIDRVMGRSDDMVKIKGVNIYPGQIDHFIKQINGLSSEYQLVLKRLAGKDQLLLRVEGEEDYNFESLKQEAIQQFKSQIGIIIDIEIVPIGMLPRTEKKSKRILDYREQ